MQINQKDPFLVVFFFLFLFFLMHQQKTKIEDAEWDGGILSTKDPMGLASNMGSKISLLVYEWPLIKCKIWVHEWVDFSKSSQIWI